MLVFVVIITELKLSNLDEEMSAFRDDLQEATKKYFTSDEHKKLDVLKLMILDNQPAIIFGETGE